MEPFEVDKVKIGNENDQVGFLIAIQGVRKERRSCFEQRLEN